MTKGTNNISRRSFIKGTSVTALGMAALGVAACTPSDKSNSTTNSTAAVETSSLWTIPELPEPSETVQADVVIVGGGGTGVSAAIQCKQLGLDPFVVDCGVDYGGSFIETEGFYGVQTHWTKAAGETLTVAKAIDQCLVYHHWIPNHELYMNFFGQTAETIEWVEDLGVEFAAVVPVGNSAIAWHVYARNDKSSPGKTFMEGMGKAAKDLGVRTQFEAFGKKILMEDGKVAGILAEKSDGSVLKVEASAVIIGTGGYSTNSEMIYELSNSQNENIFSVGPEIRNGDGLIMARDAGADLAESPGTIIWCGPWIQGISWASDGYCVAVQPTLWINDKGKRFCNEDLWLYDFSGAGMAMRNQKRTYTLFGENHIEQYLNEGPFGTVFTFAQPGTPILNARKDLEGLSTVHIGESLSALAEEVGIDADALQETLESYNAMCDAGEDTEFMKDAKYMSKIEAPYWLCETSNGYYTTCGGIKVSPRVEALDTDNNVIPGLYAGGSDAGGLNGDSYDVRFAPGSQASWAINSGRLAAKSAAEYLK